MPLGEIDLPPLPTSADLSSLLGLLPAGLDLNDLDLLKGPGGTNGLSDLLGSLPINLFNPTFKITDEPGSWFDSGLTLFGGKSLAPVLKLPGHPDQGDVHRRPRHRAPTPTTRSRR